MCGWLVQEVGGECQTSWVRVIGFLAVLAAAFVVVPAVTVLQLGGPVWLVRACAAGFMPAVALWVWLLRRGLRPLPLEGRDALNQRMHARRR